MKIKNPFLYSLFIFFVLWFSVDGFAQSKQSKTNTYSDSATYGKTPNEYAPYHRFEKPYKRFFLDTLEYPGYGRHIPEPQHIDTVKIGFIGPIIGPRSEAEKNALRVNQRMVRWDGYSMSHLAPIGIKMLQGAQLAIEEANERGGFRSKIPYKLIARNDNGNWRSSGREVIDLAYKDSVWAILGTVDGANSHIAIRVALKAEVPVMNSADTDPTFVETSIPWVFRCITDDRQMCYLLADFAFKNLGLKRIAALRAVNRYGRMSIDEFRDAATRLGNPFLSELQYQEGDIDFSKQLRKIKALNVDAIITYGNAKESAMILKQMREMGMNQWFFGSDRMIVKDFTDIVGTNHGKVAAGYPYNPGSLNPQLLAFQRNFKKRFGDPPETYAAHAYDGMQMLIEAIEKAGLNKALIRDQLVSMSNYEGITGTKEFDAVLTNRSPASLALLKNGAFVFYSTKDVLTGKVHWK